MDQAENEFQHSLFGRHGKRRSGKHLNKNYHSRAASGTCNVCSAPCFSCMHHNQPASGMESNIEGGSSEESSFANSVVKPPCKSSLLDDQHHAASDVSNLQCTSSSHDSFSENAESKANAMMPDLQSEDVDMPLKPSCSVEVGQGDVLGKMLDQRSNREPSLFQRHCEVPMRQNDSTPAVPLVVDNVEGKAASNDAVDVVECVADRKTSSFMGDSFCMASQNSFKNAKNDVGKEILNTSGQLLYDISNQQSENVGNSLKEPETRGSQTDNENSESDILEDDVKVCDICGDVGREELLAVCTRCSDGAEHTYCMRIMLDKLPEGDWLCEECKLKDDAESKLNNKSEDPEDSSNSMLPNLGARSAATMAAYKGFQNSLASGKISSVSIETSLESNTRAAEVAEPDAPSSGTMNNVKAPLIHEASFKITSSKMKSGNISSHSRGQSVVSLATPVLAPNSSKTQARHLSPRGASLTLSMDNLKPKVKKVMETLKPQSKVAPESIVANVKKERASTMVRSSSFRSQNTNSSNLDSTGKIHSINRVDAQNMLLGKQKSLMERKNSFILEKSQSNLSAFAPTNISSKLDQKGARPDGRSEKAPIIRGMADAQGSVGANETRKLPSHTPKNTGSGQPTPKDLKLGQIIPKEDSSASLVAGDRISDLIVPHAPSQSELCVGRDEKNKEMSGSRPLPFASGRSLRCQRCNEMGHLMQFCAVDKLRLSTPKPSSERNVRDVGSKSNKWRHAVVATILKTRTQKNNGLPSEPNDPLLANNGLSREISSKDLQSNLAVLGRSSSVLEGTKPGILHDIQQHVGSHVEGTPASRDNDSTFNIGPKSKYTVQNILPQQAFLRPTPSTVSAIPELGYVWQGCFEVQNNGRFSDKCNGVQAHLSTFASPRVFDVAAKFPSKIQLEEVSWTSAWPPQFCGKCPTEENIALFFFATDAESYEKSYRRLLENMLRNDLALKGNVDGLELLIFPSNKLPENSQRWNRLFFLWSVFRANKSDCPVPSDSLNIAQNFVQDFPHPLSPNASNQLVKACETVDRELPICGKAVKSGNDYYNTDESTLHQYKLPYGKQLTSSNTITEQASFLDDFAKQIIDNQLCGERKENGSYQKKIAPVLMRGKEVESGSLRTSSIEVGSSEGRVSPLYMSAASGGSETLPDSDELTEPKSSVAHGKVVGGNACKGKIMTNERLDTVAVSSQVRKEHGLCKESPSWDPRPKLKRSSSIEPAAQVSTSIGGTISWEERNHLSHDSRGDNKKIKLCADDYCLIGRNENVDHRFSSKVHPIIASFSDEARQGSAICNEKVFPEGSTSSEMAFFPVDSSSSPETQPSGFISFPVVSSAGQGSLEPDTPNLDLALGAESKPRAGILPFFPLPVRGSEEVKPPDPLVDNGDDVSASLSLSLAFPFPEERQAPKRTEQLLPKRAHPDTSLLLFGRFTDS